MGDNSKIAWTDATWGPTLGCSRVSDGCSNCYAIQHAHRLAGNPNAKISAAYAGLTRQKGELGLDWTGVVRAMPDRLDQPLRWRRPRRIFVDSMSDLFHPAVPDEFIAEVFAVMALSPQHTYQILTKRPERMQRLLSCAEQRFSDSEFQLQEIMSIAGHKAGIVWDSRGSDASKYWNVAGLRHLTAEQLKNYLAKRRRFPGWPLPNVWLGTSVESQAVADERIPHLLATPAAVRFLSCEPLLGPVNLGPWVWDEYPPTILARPSGHIDWVIIGGESGPRARELSEHWIEALISQCRNTKTPVFVKQLGSVWARANQARDSHGGDPAEWPAHLRVREFPKGHEAA